MTLLLWRPVVLPARTGWAGGTGSTCRVRGGGSRRGPPGRAPCETGTNSETSPLGHALALSSGVLPAHQAPALHEQFLLPGARSSRGHTSSPDSGSSRLCRAQGSRKQAQPRGCEGRTGSARGKGLAGAPRASAKALRTELYLATQRQLPAARAFATEDNGFAGPEAESRLWCWRGAGSEGPTGRNSLNYSYCLQSQSGHHTWPPERSPLW